MYWSKHGIITEVLLSAGVMLLILAAVLTVYFGTIGAPAKASPVPEPVPDLEPDPVIIPTVTISQSTEYVEPEVIKLYRTGGHYLDEFYSWQRLNVSGQKNMRVRVSVYGYRFLQKLTEYWDSWGRYFEVPADPGKQYLIIYVNMTMVGTDQSWDPRMWGMEQDHFTIQNASGTDTYGPDPDFYPCTQVRELEHVWDSQHVAAIQSYGYFVYNDYNSPKSCESLGYLRMGASNAWDGFIVYQVPDTWGPEDVYILGRFDGFGSAYWVLKEGPNDSG